MNLFKVMFSLEEVGVMLEGLDIFKEELRRMEIPNDDIYNEELTRKVETTRSILFKLRQSISVTDLKKKGG